MFKTYGEGSKGRKAEDLEQYESIITELGMKIPGGLVILTGVFFQMLEALGLSEDSAAEQLLKKACPDFLLAINEKILAELKAGVPYAIRSSALSECGGTGIYQSTFFVPTGDCNCNYDLQLLWEKECEVYASELSADAKAWREKNKAEMGMAILIQPVQGFELEDCWLPSLSGVAYTSYQGLPTVRLVVGLGTQAVKGGGIIYNQIPNPEPAYFQRNIWDVEEADMIDLKTGNVGQISSQNEVLHYSIGFQAFRGFFDKLNRLKQHGDFSLEWTLVEDQISIVQCAPYVDHLPGDMTIDTNRYFLLAQGSDVFNSGRNVCRAVVYVHDWSPVTADRLESLNRKLANYLLIVPQDATSLLAGLGEDKETGRANVRLGFRHFSNAAAVIEEQISYTEKQRSMMRATGMKVVDHSEGRGVSHFQQLCSRSDILFIGTKLNTGPLFGLAGRMDYGDPVDISVWEMEAIVMVDGTKKEGYAYLAKEAKKNRYCPEQVEEFSMALRQAANAADESKAELAAAFYNIHYAIAPNDNSPVGFDPFRLAEDMVEERGREGLKRDLQVVSENQDLVTSHLPDRRRNEFRRYLKDLAKSLAG